MEWFIDSVVCVCAYIFHFNKIVMLFFCATLFLKIHCKSCKVRLMNIVMHVLRTTNCSACHGSSSLFPQIHIPCAWSSGSLWGLFLGQLPVPIHSALMKFG